MHNWGETTLLKGAPEHGEKTQRFITGFGTHFVKAKCQWLFLVPLKGRWHIIPRLAVYTTYILPSGRVICYLPPFREPETTIENGNAMKGLILQGLLYPIASMGLVYLPT